MEFPPGHTHLMPISFGPLPPHPAGKFEDVRTLMVVMRTTEESIARLLPPGFEPTSEALLYCYVQRCRGVNFLAGGEYRLFGCNVSARYVGSGPVLEGQFALILWENDIEAIIRGREILGIPKLLAEIDDPIDDGMGFQISAKERGLPLISMRMTSGVQMSEAGLQELRDEMHRDSWFGWKHIPSVDGIGVEVSHPTRVGIVQEPVAGWDCSGSIAVHSVEWPACPTSARIVAGLRSMPVLEVVRAYRTEGTVTLTRADHQVLGR